MWDRPRWTFYYGITIQKVVQDWSFISIRTVQDFIFELAQLRGMESSRLYWQWLNDLD